MTTNEPVYSVLNRTQHQPDQFTYSSSMNNGTTPIATPTTPITNHNIHQQYEISKFPDSDLEFESELFSRTDSTQGNGGQPPSASSFQYSMLSLSKSVIKPEMYQLTFDVNPSTMLMDDSGGGGADEHRFDDQNHKDGKLDPVTGDIYNNEFKRIILNEPQSTAPSTVDKVYTVQPNTAVDRTVPISQSPHRNNNKSNVRMVTRLLNSGQISSHTLGGTGGSGSSGPVPMCCCSLM